MKAPAKTERTERKCPMLVGVAYPTSSVEPDAEGQGLPPIKYGANFERLSGAACAFCESPDIYPYDLPGAGEALLSGAGALLTLDCWRTFVV